MTTATPTKYCDDMKRDKANHSIMTTPRYDAIPTASLEEKEAFRAKGEGYSLELKTRLKKKSGDGRARDNRKELDSRLQGFAAHYDAKWGPDWFGRAKAQLFHMASSMLSPSGSQQTRVLQRHTGSDTGWSNC